MRAALRLIIALFAGGLLLAPSMVLAQSTAQPTANAPATNTPAPDTVGPRELQNFNLNGTVTRPAETPPAATTRAPARQPAAAPESRTAAGNAEAAPPPRRPTAQPPAPARNNRPSASAGQSLALDFPAAGPTAAATASVPQSDPLPAAAAPAPSVTDQLLLWPWVLLAGFAAAAAAFLLWRRNSHEALAGGPPIDDYVAPEPAPVPRPVPVPAAKPAAPVGIVSTRLRPWIEIAFAPLGCIVEDERVTIEFEIQLRNSGSALARDILVEASLFNAGPTQDQDIDRFFAEPVGQGERIAALPPLQNMTIRTALVAPRANIQLFELGGRQVFVPLIAFNVLYRLSGGRGQTSVSYMLGRESKGEKLGPLRLDLGPRAFTKLGIRPLPTSVRK